MSQWRSAKAKHVLIALMRIGWQIKRETGGSHRILTHPDWPDFVFAFHDREEIGPKMLARIAKCPCNDLGFVLDDHVHAKRCHYALHRLIGKLKGENLYEHFSPHFITSKISVRLTEDLPQVSLNKDRLLTVNSRIQKKGQTLQYLYSAIK